MKTNSCDNIRQVESKSHFVEMTHDTLIWSYNMLHEKNIQMGHMIRNCKKEVRYLRRQLEMVHTASTQPKFSDIAHFELHEDKEYDSGN